VDVDPRLATSPNGRPSACPSTHPFLRCTPDCAIRCCLLELIGYISSWMPKRALRAGESGRRTRGRFTREERRPLFLNSPTSRQLQEHLKLRTLHSNFKTNSGSTTPSLTFHIRFGRSVLTPFLYCTAVLFSISG